MVIHVRDDAIQSCLSNSHPEPSFGLGHTDTQKSDPGYLVPTQGVIAPCSTSLLVR